MTLDRLKKLAEARTKGEWCADDGSIGMEWPAKHKDINYSKGDRGVGFISFPAQYHCECGAVDSDADSEFFAAMANNIDKLLAVVEAAKKHAVHAPECSNHYDSSLCYCFNGPLIAALKSLEQE